jgi:hypothetical protein
MVITCLGLCCCMCDLKLVRLRIELKPDTTEMCCCLQHGAAVQL